MYWFQTHKDTQKVQVTPKGQQRDTICIGLLAHGTLYFYLFPY